MRKLKVTYLFSFLLILTLLITACSSKMDKGSSKEATNTMAVSFDSDMTSDSSAVFASGAGKDDIGEVAPTADQEEGVSSTSALNSGTSSEQTLDKIIRRFYLDVETREFDSIVSTIDSEISRLGGYVESSQIGGKSYYNNYDYRSGQIVARIPSDRVDEFVKTVNDNANVVSSKEDTENVTLEYIDMESRMKALEIEQERLFAILEKEDSLENIVTLESRLSDIRYEMQNYESKLRYYDNLVAYSTVTMTINEVERITPVREEKQTVGTRIKDGFSDTIYHISEGFQNFFVWFVVNLPYLLIWGVIITVAVLVILRIVKKNQAKPHTPQPIKYYGQLSNEYHGSENSDQPMDRQTVQNQANQGNTDQNQPNR
jgi:hypothetical protein